MKTNTILVERVLTAFKILTNQWYLCLTGGTSVSGALECPEEEKRMIVSVDTSQMVGFDS